MGQKKIFNLFGLRGLDARDKHGLTKLYRAARHGDIPKVKRLLIMGADPNKKTKCGLRPLHIAAYWGEVKIVKALLKAGADPTLDNGLGWTPLHSASLNAGLRGRQDVIDLLIENGAKMDSEDTYGWTPQDYKDLWKDVNIKALRDVMRHIQKDTAEASTHQPNMDALGMKKPSDTLHRGRENKGNTNDKDDSEAPKPATHARPQDKPSNDDKGGATPPPKNKPSARPLSPM